MYETIQFGLSDGIARLTLCRPERLNSFNARMHAEVADALKQVTGQNGARVLLLTGTGRGFCAGQDLNDRSLSATEASPDLGKSVEDHYNPLIRTLTGLEMPVVCAVNGVAAGAGANIAFACDIVLAARSAKFIMSFASIGLIPDSGGTWHLPRSIGLPRALGMALTGDPVSAETAEGWGLIWKCLDDDALTAEAERLAVRFATGPTQGLAATKRAIRASSVQTLDAELDHERDLMRLLGRTEDYREGVAAFVGKRPPVFTGR